MMDTEKAGHLLAHALTAAAQHARFRRTFDKRARSALLNCGCNDAQIERLQRILAAIAYYSEAGPRLADVRAMLAGVAAQAHAAAGGLRAIMDAPEHEEARDEARLRMLEALLELHPERCERDAAKAATIGFGDNPRTRYDPRLDEARRLLAAIADVARAADHAREGMRGAPQTRKRTEWYPVALIDAGLSVAGPTVPLSATKDSQFLRIAQVCYAAALGSKSKPLRAIRAYLAAQQQP